MKEIISRFLAEQTCATVCCTDETGMPYCFSCYYVFNKEKAVLYFKSSADTHHSGLLSNNPVIAGTVLPDKLDKMITRGIQFRGELLGKDHPLAKDAFVKYHKQLPLAITFKGDVFAIQINELKMTDSSLGFGKKITWSRNA